MSAIGRIVSFIEDLGSVVLHPEETFKMFLAERRSLLQPAILLIVYVLSTCFLSVLVIKRIASVVLAFIPLEEVLSAFNFTFRLITPLMVAGLSSVWLALFLLLALLTYVYAKAFDGVGTMRNTLFTLCYVSVPGFLVTLGLALTLASPIYGSVALVALTLLAIVVKLYIMIEGVKIVHDISDFKAFISIILAFITIVVIFVIIIMVPSLGW